jgi:hypothetical protein
VGLIGGKITLSTGRKNTRTVVVRGFVRTIMVAIVGRGMWRDIRKNRVC